VLGLGNSITSGSYSAWSPTEISGLSLWLKANTNITADEDSGGSAVTHSTASGDMADLDRINAWNAVSPTTINAVQATSADKPRWEPGVADLGGLNFKANAKFMTLSSNVTLNGVFTIAVYIRPNDLSSVKTLFAIDGNEFFQFSSNKLVRLKVDNNTIDFEESSDVIPTDSYVTLILTRNASDEWNLFVKGDSVYTTEQNWGDADQTVTGGDGIFAISHVGAKNPESNNFNGIIKDIVIYDGIALDAIERAKIYDYF